MNVSIILILLLFGALATYFAGDKLAKTVAFTVSLASFAASVLILNQHNAGISSDFNYEWISNPNIFLASKVDGLSVAMMLLTTALTAVIIFSSFGSQYKNSKAFYALVLFMAFAMVGTFISADAFVYYIFWELALIPIYFIALVWGSGTIEERKRAIVKFFIYTLAGSLFMLAAFIYLFQKAGTLMINDLYLLQLTEEEQFWIFGAFFLAYAIKIPIFPFLFG